MTDLPGVDLLRDLAETLDAIEDAQGSIGLKYHMASKILSGRTFDASKAPFQEFDTLVKVRNEIVHPRHRDRTREGGYTEPTSPAIRDLQQRGLTTTRGRKPGDAAGGISWLNEIECARTATWACQTAREIITAVLAMFPQDFRLTAINHFRDRIRQMAARGSYKRGGDKFVKWRIKPGRSGLRDNISWLQKALPCELDSLGRTPRMILIAPCGGRAGPRWPGGCTAGHPAASWC